MARWLTAVLAPILVLGTVACKDKKRQDGKTGSAEQADPAKVAKPANPAVAAVAAAQDDLGLLPVDSEGVFGVNWAQLQASPLWKQLIEPEMLKDADFTKGLATFKERCGFDPLTTVKRIALSVKGLGAEEPDVVIVVHGLDKAKTLACSEKWQAEATKENATIKRDGDIVVVSGDHPTDAAAAMFISGDRLLVHIGPTANADTLKKAAQGGSTLSTSAAFVDMYGKINKSDSAWFLMNGNAKIFEEAASLGIRPKAVFGSANVTDAVTADVRARLDSADQAAQTVTNFRGQLQAVQSFFDKLDIAADAADVKITAAASSAKLQGIIKLATGGGM